MSDAESVKKMLRSVLQTSKLGVSINNLQSEYYSLCGEAIPLKKLGYPKLEDYLRSIPSVVRLVQHMGELKCFAAVCKETAHVAELVAKQRNPKKAARSQVVNSNMRYRPSNPYMLNVTPRSSLRQPSSGGQSKWNSNRSWLHSGQMGRSASGDYRRLDQKLSFSTPVEHRQPAPLPAVRQKSIRERKEAFLVNRNFKDIPLEQASRRNGSQIGPYDTGLVQSNITKLLKKYSNGLWMSKLSEVYSEMFSQTLHPQALVNLDKWPHVCMVEKPSITNRSDCLIYPPLNHKPSVLDLNDTKSSSVSCFNSSTLTAPAALRHLTTEQPSSTLCCSVLKPGIPIMKHLANTHLGFLPKAEVCASVKVLSSVTLRSPAHNHAAAPNLPQFFNRAVNANDGYKDDPRSPAAIANRNIPPLAPTWTCLASSNTSTTASSLQPKNGILPLLKDTPPFPSSSSVRPPSKSSDDLVSAEVLKRIRELLSKYSFGLWAHALPKLFMDTYKMPFPEHILQNLSLLIDICAVEYPFSNDKKKAILYNSSRGDVNVKEGTESQLCKRDPLPSGVEVLGPKVPPSLDLPLEQYPSVLVTEVKSSNAVTVRFVGENYSDSQEAMEDEMQSFYRIGSRQRPLSKPAVGQLVTVRGEEGDEVARGQVMEVVNSDKVKVYYVDYGFSVERGGTDLLELHEHFLHLPFQAINVRLAGLEAFSSNSLVLSSLDKLAVGNILLMETLEPRQHNEVPLVVLYDTSQDDDVNINSNCLKALQDKTMNNPLSVAVAHQDVCVSNVCADGTIYCQLPSRGTARLRKLLEEAEAYFVSQMTSESLVSRPFSGMFCLARYKGNWARAEITNMHGHRVMEILFIDLGVPATVEVTDLREIPPRFLKDFTIIPPQALNCQLADVTVPDGGWSNEVTLWVKQAVLGAEDCKMKILKSEDCKGKKVVQMYLFIGGDGQELHKSINHQLAQSEMWQKLMARSSNNNGSPVPVKLPPSSPNHGTEEGAATTGIESLPLPPPLELPQPGQNMDVFVPMVHHPGYFVVQPWQDLHKLEVLMGEMVLYYNETTKTNTTIRIQKGGVYAAKVDKNWHRVQVKGILASGLVSVYELDYGKHELVSNTLIQPLLEEFRQLPFQALIAQLAGVTQHEWSKEASVMFRNYVEKRALVAQVDSVHNVKGELWEHKLTVYLVDTASEDRDLWVHSIMTDLSDELS